MLKQPTMPKTALHSKELSKSKMSVVPCLRHPDIPKTFLTQLKDCPETSACSPYSQPLRKGYPQPITGFRGT